MLASEFAEIGRVSARVLRQVSVRLQRQRKLGPTWSGSALGDVGGSARGYAAKRRLAPIREGDANMSFHCRSRVRAAGTPMVFQS